MANQIYILHKRNKGDKFYVQRYALAKNTIHILYTSVFRHCKREPICSAKFVGMYI